MIVAEVSIELIFFFVIRSIVVDTKQDLACTHTHTENKSHSQLRKVDLWKLH